MYTMSHGDCLELMDDIPDGSVDMVMADLPYGTTNCKWDSVIPFEPLWAHYKRVCKKNAAIVLTASQPFTSALVMSNAGMFKYEWIWEKPNGTNPMLVKKQPFRAHENVLVFYKEQPAYRPKMTYGHSNYSGFRDDTKLLGEVYTGGVAGKHTPKSRHKENNDGSRYPKSVQLFAQERGTLHPTQKPVALMEYLILTYTNPGELVLDNTMGSGTTGVACAQTGRRFWGIEMDATYFTAAEKRVQAAYFEHHLVTPNVAGAL